MIEDFPGNSQRPVPSSARDTPPAEEPKLSKVVTGTTVRRKKSLGRRLLNTFFGGDSGVFSYLLKEVLVPALQDVATDVVKQGIDKAVYGEVRTPRSARGSSGVSRTHVSYDRASSVRASHSPVRRPAVPQRSSLTVDDIVLDSLIDAQTVTGEIYDVLRRYNVISLANVYELVGQTPNFTDHKYGWYELDDMDVKRIGSQYLLILPDPEPLRR